jgi:hypothetical protein
MPGPELDKAAAFGAGHLVKQTGAGPANGKSPPQLHVPAKIGNDLRRSHFGN